MRRILYGALLLLALLQLVVTSGVVLSAWHDYRFANTIRRVDEIAGQIAYAFPTLGYERGRISSILNRGAALDDKNRDYIAAQRQTTDRALRSALLALSDFQPALGSELAALAQRLPRCARRPMPRWSSPRPPVMPPSSAAGCPGRAR